LIPQNRFARFVQPVVLFWVVVVSQILLTRAVRSARRLVTAPELEQLDGASVESS
jgi:hypothetical protein